MAKTFTHWTVLEHRPIERLAENLWRVEGKMPDGRTQRQMVVARRSDGALVIYNAIALDDTEMKELEAFGRPGMLVVPNGFHRQDALIYKERYPDLRVYAPAGARKKVSQVVFVEGDFDQAPFDDAVRLLHLDGVSKSEGVMQVSSSDGTTLVFNDVVLNMSAQKGIMKLVLGPTGRPSVPRVVRLVMMRDKRALSTHLARLAETPRLVRVLVGHGSPIVDRPAEALRAVARELLGKSERAEQALAH